MRGNGVGWRREEEIEVEFEITYSCLDNTLVEQLKETLKRHGTRIMQFFRLECLKEKLHIMIYSNPDDYIKHVEECGQIYYQWMIADTFDGKINLLAPDVCKKVDFHRNLTYDQYTKLIIHEFVHICQQEVNPDSYGCEWFWEALATNLAEQEMECSPISCTEEDLMYGYAELPNAYSVSYCMGRYMLNNLSGEKIYEYISKPAALRKDAGTILHTVIKSLEEGKTCRTL